MSKSNALIVFIWKKKNEKHILLVVIGMYYYFEKINFNQKWDTFIRVILQVNFYFRDIFQWRQCHCRSCICDKEFASCITSYRCPYKISSIHLDGKGKNMTRRYLSAEDCNNSPINVLEFISI